jgi:uncharacterized protein YoxC
MMTNRLTVLAVCLAVGLGAVSEPSMAKKKKNKKQVEAVQMLPEYDHPSGKGYPNGRPWQATAYDFEIVKHKLDVLDYKVDEVKGDTETIISEVDDVMEGTETIISKVDDVKADTESIITKLDEVHSGIDGIGDEIAGIADDVEMLKNTLSLEVEVGSVSALGATLYVHVSQNGVAVGGLSADAFVYDNAFPAAGASYCGDACFAEGAAGVYMIDLSADAGPGSYAGALAVVTTDDGDGDEPDVASGTSLVTFSVEVTPEPL